MVDLYPFPIPFKILFYPPKVILTYTFNPQTSPVLITSYDSNISNYSDNYTEVLIKAGKNNTGKIYISTLDNPSKSTAFTLDSGEGVSISLVKLNKLYIWGDSSTDTFSVIITVVI